MDRSEYTVYCDESDKQGKYFSNFYGGLIVPTSLAQDLELSLKMKKDELNLFNEVKWSKVSEVYLPKYIELINCFFGLVKDEKVKVRIMFTQNYYRVKDLSKYQKENSYFLLYYQFLKHAFGFQYSGEIVQVRTYLDKLPDTREKVEQFKGYLLSLNSFPQFKNSNVTFKKDSIAEVDSKKHILLQCLDIVLGSMQFKLNNKHKEIPEGKKRRGKKTLAKEKLYKYIYGQIDQLVESKFNPGITTGRGSDIRNIWRQPYRHWRFVPKKHFIDKSKKK